MAIKQFDEEGNWIGVYRSPGQAEHETGVNASNIYKVLRGERNSAGHFGWTLVEA